MKKIIFLFLFSLSAFAVDCELIDLKSIARKSISNNTQLVFKDIYSSSSAVSEYEINSNAKLQLRYITKLDPITGSDFVVALLELLVHKGGNGYTAVAATSAIENQFLNNKVIFDLNYIFDSRSESLDYQLSERISLQDYILECSVL